MGQVVYFICDRCQKTQESDAQLWTVGIVCYQGTYKQSYVALDGTNAKQLWCRDCVDTIDLLNTKANEFKKFTDEQKAKAPPQLSFEDKIGQLVHEVFGDYIADVVADAVQDNLNRRS